ncbi:mRNA cap guanine-N7 methyltransferase [Escovopsis weberi]|uniref:mRNA cap guanine-N(7) methyltransferase n=1 Tax=Escovopsis weberi TaxID=150374 RepID=A0A0N0RSY5_ESCWE|nr:mRNA cap guanine-N7 methyltransferase [Escovopsis weberi]
MTRDDRDYRDDTQRRHKRRAEDDAQDDLPQPYNANSLQASKRRAVSPSEQPRKLKRPGARARISEAEREAIRQRQIERDRQAAEAAAVQTAEVVRARGTHDVVREHYNSVPERGRDWRTRDSKIKGLRVFNNWIKSCIIQRYSPDEDHTPGSREQGRSSGRELLILDIGCGKGGDLSKWQQAPQPIQLYVGLDPANVSIEQARDRYRNLSSRGGGRGGRGGRFGSRPPPRLFDARFHVKDCYAESIEDVEIIRQVGFDPSTMNRRGFDVVSMMFSMHYAFESEKNARIMLRNVAGALKKGGRFIGCIPNSDVLGDHVRAFNARMAAKRDLKNQQQQQQHGPDGARPDGENQSEGRREEEEEDGEEGEEGEDGGEPASTTPPPPAAEPEDGEVEDDGSQHTAEWGNSIYRVRFPGKTPEDGIFRPAYGWKYNFFLDEAVEEVPEYVVPWEAFRALAEDFNLELQFHKTFPEIWESEKDDRELGPLSERMGVRERGGGPLLVSDEEMEAASFYIGFCFYKV